MVLDDLLLDPSVSYGFIGGPGGDTLVQSSQSRHQTRVQRASQLIRRWRPSRNLMTPAAWEMLLNFYHGRRGSFRAFRFKDWLDYSTGLYGVNDPTPDDVVIGTGTGVSQTYQLIKKYPDVISPYPRKITLPEAGSVVLKANGVQQFGFAMSNPGGVITGTWTGLITVGFRFHVPVIFDPNVGRQLAASIDVPGRVTVADFSVMEVLDEVQDPERFDHGGAEVLTMTTPIALSLWGGKVKKIIRSTSGAQPAYLPPPNTEMLGHVFRIFNDGSSTGSIDVRDDAGNLIVNIAAGNKRDIDLVLNDDTTFSWLQYP